jgi:hypothetical protein
LSVVAVFSGGVTIELVAGAVVTSEGGVDDTSGVLAGVADTSGVLVGVALGVLSGVGDTSGVLVGVTLHTGVGVGFGDFLGEFIHAKALTFNEITKTITKTSPKNVFLFFIFFPPK